MFKKKIKEEKKLNAREDGQKEEIFFSERKTVQDLIAPHGINPNPLDYIVVDDGAQPLYTICMYIDKMPRSAEFARTFPTLFNVPGVTSNVFIEPMLSGKSTKKLDKRIVSLTAEQIGAQKSGDRNRYRKISSKIRDAENYAEQVESGDNTLFEVSFLFILQERELDKLRLTTSDFHMKGREVGIELTACYSLHAEAFLSGYPTNRVYRSSDSPASLSVIKKHVFDKSSLATIFNHTRSSFSHKNGIIGGRNLYTGQPFLYDVYDPSHDGYGVIICGKTGVGKSATIKMYLSRYVDFGYRIRSIDFDSKGTTGEYGLMAQTIGGVNYQIKPESKNILNLYDIDAEEEFDEITGKIYKVLNLTAKKVDLKNLIMIMIMNGQELSDFSETKFMEKIVVTANNEIYNDLGIVNGEEESLYEYGNIFSNGKMGSGKRKKKLPTITDFYMKVLDLQKKNKNKLYDRAYTTILDSMCDYVRELNYCPDCLVSCTREEIAVFDKDGEAYLCPKCKRKMEMIQGIRPYFDGQSTIHADSDPPHINIDISQLPESERIVALLIVLSFMQENYIKKNSSNPKEAKKMVALIDELHRTFPYAPARLFISDWYRTARKRNVSPWSATQALADYAGYIETESIIKNSTTIMLFKQDFQDREFLQKATPLTDSQIETVVNLGGDPLDNDSKNRKGEMCLIDNRRVVFLKVDYLTKSESKIVETDMNEIAKMYQKNMA